MGKPDALTQEYVREAFDYVDGALFWKERPVHHFKRDRDQKTFNTRYAHKRAGCLEKKEGYWWVSIADRHTALHRVVFLWHHGYLPELTDHIDGDRANNRIENLRAANIAQNSWNMKRPVCNTSGCKGVLWVRRDRKWLACIVVSKQRIQLGYFDDFEPAVLARKEAEKKYYGEFASDR